MCFYGKVYDMGLGPFLKGMRHWVTAYIRHNQLFPMLDLCTGTGALCRLFSSEGNRSLIWGLDLDRRILDYARTRSPHTFFIQGDAACLPFSNDSFQGMVVSYALHEKTERVRGLMMKEIHRVLKPEGRILMIDFEKPWDLTSRLGRLITYTIERLAGGEHFRNSQRFLDAGGLRGFLDRQGWEELESRAIPWGNTRIVVAGAAAGDHRCQKERIAVQ